MALSTRATLAAVGGAIAIGALGVTSVAYATESGNAAPSYVTTVDEGSPSTAPSAPSDRDCPDKGGSTGSDGSTGPEGSTGSEGSTDGAADA